MNIPATPTPTPAPTTFASDSSGANLPSPPGGIVYTYLMITPIRHSTITGATIQFTVPESWFADNNMVPENLVMYHYTGGTWIALPTTVVRTANGQVHFSATTTGFSWFAISIREKPNPAGKTSAQQKASGDFVSAATTAVTVHATTAPTAPGPASTDAPPAPAAAEPGFPLATAALIGAGCIVLIGGGWYIRRWWIRRQNPALFEDF